jgi:O-antigen/teichoic acid export membrane protein
MNNFLHLFKHSKNYLLGNLATKSLGLISIPILTSLLSPLEYGIIGLYTGYIAVLTTLLTFNFYSALGRYYFENKSDFNSFFGTLLILSTVTLVIFFYFFYLYSRELSQLLTLPENLIFFIVPSVLIFTYSSFYEQIYSAQQKSKHIVIRNIIVGYSTVFLTILWVYLLENDRYLGFIYSNIFIGFIFIAYYIYILKPYIILSFNIKHLKYIFSYSIPLIPYTLTWALMPQIDKIMINKILGGNDVGIYTFALNIGALLFIVSSSIYQAWNPIYYKYMNEGNYKRIDNEANVIFKVIMACALILIYYGNEIGMLLGNSSYYSAFDVIPIIVLGYVFNTIFMFYGWGIGYAKKNIYLSIVVVVSTGINILLNILFIPKLGYIGAAIATSIAYFLLIIFTWFTNKYILKIYTISLYKIFIQLFVFGFFVIIFYIIEYMNFGIYDIFLKLLFISMFIISIFYKYIFMSTNDNLS